MTTVIISMTSSHRLLKWLVTICDSPSNDFWKREDSLETDKILDKINYRLEHYSSITRLSTHYRDNPLKFFGFTGWESKIYTIWNGFRMHTATCGAQAYSLVVKIFLKPRPAALKTSLWKKIMISEHFVKILARNWPIDRLAYHHSMLDRW